MFGGKSEFVESRLISSCSSCKDEGHTVASVRYCVDCEEYQCNKCFKSHDRYSKGHEVYGASSRHKWGSKKQVKLPTERCPTHIGEVLQLFCEDHDAVCCHVCIAMKHSTCQRKQYIPEVAKNITKQNKEFEILNDTLDKIRTHIQTVIDDSNNNKESIRMSREKFKKQLQETRQHFEALYTKLEQTSNAELSQSHDTIDAEVDGIIKSSNALLTEVNGLRERVNPDVHTNESQLYINMKQVNGKLTGMVQKVERVSIPQPTSIECQISPEVNTFLRITKCLSTSKVCPQYQTNPELTNFLSTCNSFPLHKANSEVTKGILTSKRIISQGTPTNNLQAGAIQEVVEPYRIVRAGFSDKYPNVPQVNPQLVGQHIPFPFWGGNYVPGLALPPTQIPVDVSATNLSWDQHIQYQHLQEDKTNAFKLCYPRFNTP